MESHMANVRALFVFSIFLLGIKLNDAVTIDSIFPETGSTEGGTRVTITGTGFSANQFDGGNHVRLVDAGDYSKQYDCTIPEAVQTDTKMVIFETGAVPEGRYHLALAVDAGAFELFDAFNYEPDTGHTPLVYGVTPRSGPPGTVVNVYGRFFTDRYGSNKDESTNGKTVKMLRVYMGKQKCELVSKSICTESDGSTRFEIELISETSNKGYLNCSLTGTIITDANLTFVVEGEYGKSQPNLWNTFVGATNRVRLFQVYTGISSVSPKFGSTEGWTTLSINGQHFSNANSLRALVGGHECRNPWAVSSTLITCQTPALVSGWPGASEWTGNRGLWSRTWNDGSGTGAPDTENIVDDAKVQETTLNSFKRVMSGYFIPFYTGSHRFHLFGTGSATLRFSGSTGLRGDKADILSFTGQTASQWNPGSSSFDLVSGKPYYMEVEHDANAPESFVQVAARSYKSSITANQTGAAHRERQVIQVNTTVVQEGQKFEFNLQENHLSPKKEMQKVVISNVNNNPLLPFRLCLYHGCTKKLKASDGASVIQYALNNAPVIYPETVAVTQTSSDGATDAEFSVAFDMSIGDVPDLVVADMPDGTDTSITVTETEKGVPSLGSVRLQMDGKVSSVIPANPSKTDIETSLNVLFGNECPQTIMGDTDVFDSGVKIDFEEGESFSSAYGGEVTNEDSFCGRRSMKNPRYISYFSGGASLSQFSKLCFGHKGLFEGSFKLTYSHRVLSEKMTTSVGLPNLGIPTSAMLENEWTYSCLDVKSLIPGDITTPSLQSIQFLSTNPAKDDYLDVIRMASEDITVNDDNMYRQVREAAKLNSERLNTFSVATVNGGFEVALRPHNCANNIEKIGLASATESNGVYTLTAGSDSGTMTNTRISSASIPLTGNVTVSFEGKSATFDVLATPEKVEQELEKIDGIGDLDVDLEYGDCANRGLSVKWMTRAGDQEEMTINPSDLTGNVVVTDVVTKADGNIFYDPIPGDMLRTDETQPQVMLFVNDIPTSCDNDCTFNWDASYTPTVTGVTPVSGKEGDTLTVTGTGFDSGTVTATVGNSDCVIDTVSATSLSCTLGPGDSGTYDVDVVVSDKGKASGSFDFEVTETTTGAPVSNSQETTTTAAEASAAGADNTADIDESQYESEATDVTVTRVFPARGGTGGGTEITIYGSGFGTDKTQVDVTIDGDPLEITSDILNHKIVCETNAHSSGMETLTVGKGGDAATAQYEFIDVWSSSATWNGTAPPGEGELVQIVEGQTVLLDTSTPILAALLIQGRLIFDEKDITLNAKSILIMSNGKLQVGTEDEPFEHKATIQMHGTLRSTELPIYGVKGIGVRNGTLDLHGKVRAKTWTRLAATAEAGSSTLHFQDPVWWHVDDKVVIATTGNRASQHETEVRKIQSISADGATITVDSPLLYRHVGETETFGTRDVELRGEVGLLTHNVVFKGYSDPQWLRDIKACPEGFDTGEFATQTCFEGRFGDEIGTDGFGAHILVHPPEKHKDIATARISYTELFNVGQSNRLGRYPIHFHIVGNTTKSYVRGCAIYNTHNRATNIHATNNVTIEDNVIYKCHGGAAFLEDGIEILNKFFRNLAVFVRSSTSLLNDDITPASFWVTNPFNDYKGNAAAGGTHFGWWYRMHEHPDGPSYDPHCYPQNVELGVFEDNTAHSFGWFGLWIFQSFFPREGGTPYGAYKTAFFRRFTTWANEKGVEMVNSGAVQYEDFVAVHNEKAGVEVKLLIAHPQYTADSAMVKDSLIVGKSIYLDPHPWWTSDTGGCSNYGIVLPYGNGMIIMNVDFHKFQTSDGGTWSAMTTTKIDGTCSVYCGGNEYHFSGITYTSVDKKTNFQWEHQAVLVDLDGSLTGGGIPGAAVLPTNGNLPPLTCTDAPDFSMTLPASVCEPPIKFHRVSWNNILPQSLEGQRAIWTNQYGTSYAPFAKKRITHKFGWTATLMDGEEYMLSWENGEQVTNVTYEAVFYNFEGDDCIKVCQRLERRPDRVSFDKGLTYQNESDTMVQCPGSKHTDWFFDNTALKVCYIVHAQTRVRRGGPNPAVYSVDRRINLVLFKCYFTDCVVPVDPDTQAPTKTRDPDFKKWSEGTTWGKTSDTFWAVDIATDGSSGLPTKDSNVGIASDVWVLLDADAPDLPRLHYLFIDKYGTLELDDSNTAKSYTINVVYLYILGRLIIGWEERPFQAMATIILRGNHDTPTHRNAFNWHLGGPNVGSKAIGVFGGFDGHGKDISVPWTRLAATAPAGQNWLVLREPVDWLVGNEIVVTATGYNFTESESLAIKAISDDRMTLTLNSSLKYNHIFYEHTGSNPYMMAAEVGLLTRNIRIIGDMDSTSFRQAYGSRLLVGIAANESRQFAGYARISNVEFFRFGQEGLDARYDPRHGLTFLDCGGNAFNTPMYVKKVAFHGGFGTAIGVFGTSGLEISGSVIFETVGPAIITESSSTSILRTMITQVQFPGTYMGRTESDNFKVDGAIETFGATGLILKQVAISASERAGLRGEPERSDNPDPWENITIHSSPIGVLIMPEDPFSSPAPTSFRYSNLTIYRCFDFGIYYQSTLSIHVLKVTLIENGIGLFPLVVGPSAVDHVIGNKFVSVKNSVVVGFSPGTDCDDLVMSDSDVKFRKTPLARAFKLGWRGRTGLMWGSFSQGPNGIPTHPFDGFMSYMSLNGTTLFNGVTFLHFGSNPCGETDYALVPHPKNDDGIHTIFTSGLTFNDVLEEYRAHIPRPRLEKINPADCVDMDCDGLKKAVLVDLDGSLFSNGQPGTIIPDSGYEWDGDPRRGLGDYRIPKVMYTYPNGTKMSMTDFYDKKGIIRNENCVFKNEWNAFGCHNMDHRLLVIESLDSDTETRRLSPVAVLGWCVGTDGHILEKYIDLINGPQDHGWCSGYTCQKRLSTFFAVVAIGCHYKIYFTSTSPQKLRFLMLNVKEDDAITVQVYYKNVNRLDVLLDTDEYIPPTNSEMVDGKMTLKEPDETNTYKPTLSDPTGTNFVDVDYRELHITIKGGMPLVVNQTSVLIIAFNVPAMTIDEFFGERIVQNLAMLLGIPSNKIRITSPLTSSSRRRKRDTMTTVSVEIGEQPCISGSCSNSGSTLSYNDLANASSGIIEAFQTGQLASILNATIDGVSVIEAIPPTTSPEWEMVVNSSSDISQVIAVPTTLQLIVNPSPGTEGSPFTQQPQLRMLDQSGNHVTLLGTSTSPWYVQASLQSGSNNATTLSGAVNMTFVNGTAAFTDLVLSHAGSGYIVDFIITYPTSVNFSVSSPALTVARRSFTLAVTTSPTEVTVGVGFSVQLELKKDGVRVTDFEGLTWNANISLVSSTIYTGSLSGNKNVNIDNSTGLVTFSNLNVSTSGIIYLRVIANTSDNRYQVQADDIEIAVYTASQADIVVTETKTIVLKYDLDFDTYNTPAFKMVMFNTLVSMLGDAVKIYDIVLSEGSLLVTAKIGGNTTTVDTAVTDVCSSISSNSAVTYNGQSLTMQNYLTVDGKDYYSSGCLSSSDDKSTLRIGLIVGITVGVLGIAIIIMAICVWRSLVRPKTKTHRIDDDYPTKDSDQIVQYLGTSYFVDTKLWREDTFNSLREKSFLSDSPLPPMGTSYPDFSRPSSTTSSQRPKSVISTSSSVRPAERLPPLKVKGRYFKHRFF